MPGRTLLLVFGLGMALAGCQDEDAASTSLDSGSPSDELDAARPPETAAEVRRDAAVAEPIDAGEPVDAAVRPSDDRIDAAFDAGTPEDAGCGALTYENFGAEFMYSWCLSCHGKMEPLFTSQALVQLHAIEIRAATVDSDRMPAGGGVLYLRKPEREKLGRWLECGAL